MMDEKPDEETRETWKAPDPQNHPEAQAESAPAESAPAESAPATEAACSDVKELSNPYGDSVTPDDAQNPFTQD